MTADDEHAASGRVCLPEMLVTRHLDTLEQGGCREPPKLQEVYVVQRLVSERTASRCLHDRGRRRAAVDNRLVCCSHAVTPGACAGQERRKGAGSGIGERPRQPGGKGHPQAEERCRDHGHLLNPPGTLGQRARRKLPANRPAPEYNDSRRANNCARL